MNKKELYESIMKNVAKEVKKALNEDNADIQTYNKRIDKILQKFISNDYEFQNKINLYMFLKLISDENFEKKLNISPQKVRAWSKKLGKETQEKIFKEFLEKTNNTQNKNNNLEKETNNIFLEDDKFIIKKYLKDLEKLQDIYIDKDELLFKTVHPENIHEFINRVLTDADEYKEKSYKKYFIDNFQKQYESNIKKLDNYLTILNKADIAINNIEKILYKYKII